MIRALILSCAALSGTASADLLELHNPWGATDPAPAPQPYQLPRFGGDAGDHHSAIPPLQTVPGIDIDGLYRAVLSCYPERSRFNLDVELEAGYRSRQTYDLTNGSAIGRHYVGIVARMPIYSASELYREREREYARRTDTAKTIGNLVSAVAKRNHAVRELGLYSSLEARAQVRVLQGVTDTAEQVGYLQKVAGAQADLINQTGAMAEYRLALVSQCADDKAGEINAYIQRVTALPGVPDEPH